MIPPDLGVLFVPEEATLIVLNCRPPSKIFLFFILSSDANLFCLSLNTSVAYIIFICESFFYLLASQKKNEYANAFGAFCPFSCAKETDILLYTTSTINSNSLRRRTLFSSRTLFLGVFPPTAVESKKLIGRFV